MDVNLIFSLKARVNSLLETWCSYWKTRRWLQFAK